MNKSNKNRLAQMRWIRRRFWMGEIEWKEALRSLCDEHQMSWSEAENFCGDSTNLDAAARLQLSLNAIPFGISLTQPSIML